MPASLRDHLRDPRWRGGVAILCVALASMSMSAGVSAQDLTASFESEFQWFDKRKVPLLSGDDAWSAVAWRGERLRKQILIEGAVSHEGLSVTASDLLHELGAVDAIPSGVVSFRFPGFVKGDLQARDCGGYGQRGPTSWHSDALLPTPPSGLASADVEAYPLMLWMTIDVPTTTSVGKYRGKISIADSHGGEATLDVSVHVVDWSMPTASERRFHLDLWQFPVTVLDRYNESNREETIEAWSDEHFALLRPFYVYLAQMGQRAVTTYISNGSLGAPSMIEWQANQDASDFTFDYTAFDTYLEQAAHWGLDGQINAFSVAGWNAGTITYMENETGDTKVLTTRVGSKTFNRVWSAFLSDFREHLNKQGWFERTVLFMDELPSHQVESVIRLIRSDHPGWKTGLAFGHQPSRRVLESLYDRSGNFGTYDRFKLRDAHDKVTSFYTSCTQVRPNSYVAADASPVDLVAIPWHAFANGLDGYLRWAFDNWKNPDPFDPRDGAHTAGDFAIVYRSGNGRDMNLVPSVRSELLRDGIEDYEKLSVLRAMGLLCIGPCFPMRPLDDHQRGCRAHELAFVAKGFSVSRLAAGEAGALVRRARKALDRYSKRMSAYECAPNSGG